jgi:hypothetical protein
MDAAILYQHTPNQLTRRRFIRKAAATGAFIAAPQVVPSSVLGREGHTAPSMIRNPIRCLPVTLEQTSL